MVSVVVGVVVLAHIVVVPVVVIVTSVIAPLLMTVLISVIIIIIVVHVELNVARVVLIVVSFVVLIAVPVMIVVLRVGTLHIQTESLRRLASVRVRGGACSAGGVAIKGPKLLPHLADDGLCSVEIFDVILRECQERKVR